MENFDYGAKFFVVRINGFNIHALMASADSVKEAKDKARGFPPEKYGFRIDVVTRAKAESQGFLESSKGKEG